MPGPDPKTVSERAVERETEESGDGPADFAAVQAALGLLETDRADKIIGQQTEEYRTLIQGARSAMTMLWQLMKTFGVKESQQSLKGFSQAMIVVLQIVHYAYALGMERGRSNMVLQHPTDHGSAGTTEAPIAGISGA